MQGYNGAAVEAFLRRANASVARAAIDQSAPDTLDFDCPLEDVVLNHTGRCCKPGFARRYPAL
ncbi:hypothetical protein AB7008_23735 [Bradyrhizobium sp. 521_C7_N1_3]|uniref:hypothetical protein n=1 Tax=Bradyrhizobium sp. 521_C7_N1_3 TaxID=3240368 RepID=UPI003F895116